MSVGIRLEGKGYEHATDLCSTRGYALLCEWFEEHGEEFPALAELAKAGRYENTEELADQMEEAYHTAPPENPDVDHNADRLLDLLGGGDTDETLTIEM